MTHYQKFATMIFRVIGLLLIVGGLILFVQTAVSVWLLPQFKDIFLSSDISYLPYFIQLIYLLAGMILFLSARFLAIWICLDFNKFDGQK